MLGSQSPLFYLITSHSPPSISPRRRGIISHHHEKGESRTARQFETHRESEREIVHSHNFYTVYYYNHSILSLGIVNILLCLIYKVNLIIGVYRKEKLSMYRVWYYAQFQTPTGCTATYTPQITGVSCSCLTPPPPLSSHTSSLCISVSGSTFPSSDKGTSHIGFRAHPSPVRPHLHLMTSAKTPFPNEVTFTHCRCMNLGGKLCNQTEQRNKHSNEAVLICQPSQFTRPPVASHNACAVQGGAVMHPEGSGRFQSRQLLEKWPFEICEITPPETEG